MAAKKRSHTKATGRPASKKSRTPARRHTSAPARKAASATRATKARGKPAVRSGSKAKSTGNKTGTAKKPVPATVKAQTSVRVAPKSNARMAVQRPIPPRRNSMAPLTSSVGLIHGIPPYQAKPGEPYMNERQLEHFRNILVAWKRELMEEVDRTVHHMQDEASNFPDPNDRATQESEFGLELRTRDRERKLLKKIDSAIERIDDGTYGYCEETGEEIGLRRLEARPVATLSVEAQERRELAERQFRDREDGF
jgi:DnaK suppressor protein